MHNVAVATTVEVYAVDSEDRTGAFLGFGSLLDPIMVFLHTAAASPAPTKLSSRRPHRPAPVAGRRARCRIRTDHTLLTIDGAILPAPEGVPGQAPVAIQLAVGFAGDIDQVQVPQGPGHPTADEAAEAVLAFVSDAAADDPKEPASPPPAGPDVYGRLPNPGKRPWYCVICPGAWGC